MRSEAAGLLRLGGSATAAFAMRAGGAAIMLVVQLAIVRRLGPTAGGYMATALAVSGICAVLGRMGSDQLVIRRVSTATPHDVGNQRAVAIAATLPVLAALAGALFLVSGPLSQLLFGSRDGGTAFRWLAVSLPAFGVVALQGEALKGIGRPASGAAVQSLIGPAITGVLLLAVPSSSLATMSALVAAGYIAASIGAEALWRWSTDRRQRRRVSGQSRREFRSEAHPFLAAAVLSVALLYGPVIALSVVGTPDDVSAYFAADRWTQLPAMVLVAVNAVVAPRFASMWSEARLVELRRLLRRSTVATGLVAVCLTAVLVGAAPVLLGMFGEAFDTAIPALRVLAVGQFVVLAGGPVTSLLIMTGGERAYRRSSAFAAVAMALLLASLVPALGPLGAAIASAVAAVTGKVLVTMAARARLAMGTAHPAPSAPDRGSI